MPPEIVEKAHAAVRGVVDAGGRAPHVAKVDEGTSSSSWCSMAPKTPPESHATSADRGCTRTWCRYLAPDTERSVGEIIASAEGPDATGRSPASPLLLFRRSLTGFPVLTGRSVTCDGACTEWRAYCSRYCLAYAPIPIDALLLEAVCRSDVVNGRGLDSADGRR
jgi:hypothetical protein